MTGSTAVMADAPLLEVVDLKTHIETPRGIVRAVDGVSLSLGHGRTLGIVGESGSGKSMLLRSIMGLLPKAARPTGGTVTFLGKDLGSLAPSDLREIWGSGIAMAFQDSTAALNPVQRIRRQLTEGLRVRKGVRRQEANAIALNLLREVGIPDPEARLRAFPHQLSGGMRQRVAIAVSLATSPALLLADEVTSALDVTVQAQLLKVLALERRLREMSMIFVTHDLGVVAQCADDIAVMYAGRIVERLAVDSLATGARHPYTAALLACRPRLTGDRRSSVPPIPGSPPSLIDPPPGCRFAPRCAFARPECSSAVPELTTDPRDRSSAVACFFPLSGTGSPLPVGATAAAPTAEAS